jgi:DNA repair protein RecO (recombination protein O)
VAKSRVYRAEVLVLRRSNFGEADRLLTLLTRNAGKVRAIAKGARRPTSRHSGNLELFAHAELLLARGRDLDIVTQSELLHPFRRLREDLLAASHAYYLAEVTDALLEPADPAPRPFALLLEAFTALDAGLDPTLLAAHFLLQLLDVLGYRPELFACLNCAAELRPVVNYLGLSQGGAFCPACGPRQPGAQTIAVDALKLMRHLQKTQRLGGLAVVLPSGLAEQVDRLARAFAEHHIDRRLRSPEFISRLRELSDRAAAILPNTVQHAR